jgi:hypothetical protein
VRPRGYASGLRSLRPCPRNGASRRSGVGRVRSLAFLSILHNVSLSFLLNILNNEVPECHKVFHSLLDLPC